ncbi:MAG: heavy metal-binding domain-containing protein [Acidimicrobiales bacterium]
MDEAILLDEAGYEPCGMVTGSAVYRPSIFGRYASPGANVELAALSGALHEARRLAMSRLVGEAEALGAAGVAGVRLDVRGAEGAGRDMEFFALGTAVSRRGSDGRGAARVFTSNLSGQELYLLERSGHTPVGLVMGVCVYHVARRSLGSWWSGMGRNVELANPTTALYDSREIAMSRLQQEALQAGAAGVVGVRIDQRSHVWGSRVVEFVAIGTAVTSTAAPGTALTGMAASGTARSYLPLGVRFAVPLDDPVRATDPRRLLGG